MLILQNRSTLSDKLQLFLSSSMLSQLDGCNDIFLIFCFEDTCSIFLHIVSWMDQATLYLDIGTSLNSAKIRHTNTWGQLLICSFRWQLHVLKCWVIHLFLKIFMQDSYLFKINVRCLLLTEANMVAHQAKNTDLVLSIYWFCMVQASGMLLGKWSSVMSCAICNMRSTFPTHVLCKDEFFCDQNRAYARIDIILYMTCNLWLSLGNCNRSQFMFFKVKEVCVQWCHHPSLQPMLWL